MNASSLSSNYPLNLTQEEIDDPYEILDELFDFAKLPDLRDILWMWLKTTVNKSFDTCPEFERSLMLAMYEKLQKVLDATFIICKEINDLKKVDDNSDKK